MEAVLICITVAAVVLLGFVFFFCLKISNEIDKINLNFKRNGETYVKYKNKQKQWRNQQALFSKIRKGENRKK